MLIYIFTRNKSWVWESRKSEKRQDLAVDSYLIFEDIRDFGFKNQIQRAVVSISNNIAEGFDRFSDKEFIRFLNISLSSCNEVKSMLYLSCRLNYISKEQSRTLILQSEEINRIIRGFIKSLRPKD